MKQDPVLRSETRGSESVRNPEEMMRGPKEWDRARECSESASESTEGGK